MRKLLNTLYTTAGILAALFMIGCLVMVLISVFGRLLDFHLRGTDAYAGYCMAAAGFLALAHTLKRGEHIRVTLALDRMGTRGKNVMEIVSHVIGLLFSGMFAFYAARLVYQSYTLGDISQGNDASPLWIPQIAMAVGAAVLFVAIADELFLHLAGRHAAIKNNELKAME